MKDILLYYPGQEDACFQALPPAIQTRTEIARTEAQLAERLKDARILVGARWPAHVLRAASHVQWLQTLYAGVEQLVPVVPATCRITRIVGLFDDAIADWCLAFLLHFTLDVPRILNQQTSGTWKKFESPKLSEKTAVILGLGSIGSEIARRLRSCHMTVIGVRRSGEPSEVADRVVRLGDLDTVLPGADAVINLLPLTPQTDGLLNKERFAKMREALFFNAGRGRTVVEPDLLWALDEGLVRGAALDVFATEPLPPKHPFWQHPHVVVSPHIAGPSVTGEVTAFFVENLHRFDLRKPLIGEVDRRQGY